MVSEIGNVTQKNESVEDVTLQYVDVESRKKALETEQERLMELLSSAENMEDLLAIESNYQRCGMNWKIMEASFGCSTIRLITVQ